MGADAVRVAGNTIRGNHRIGVGLVRLPEEEAQKDPDLDPLPDANRLGRNVASRNGKVLQPAKGLVPYAGPVVWDGTGSDNCSVAPSAPTSLPSCDPR